MANFKTHVSFGAFVALIYPILVFTSGLIQLNFLTLVLSSISVLVGSMGPDFDHDTSDVFFLLFGLFAFLITVIFLAFIIVSPSFPVLLIFVVAPVVFIIFHRGFGLLIQKRTSHRGVFHSTPMAFVVILGMMFVFSFSSFPLFDSVTISIGFGAGWMTHQILDEIYAVDFHGKSVDKIRLKKSFGTAVDLALPIKFIKKGGKTKAEFKFVNLLIWLILAGLVFLNWNNLVKFIEVVPTAAKNSIAWFSDGWEELVTFFQSIFLKS